MYVHVHSFTYTYVYKKYTYIYIHFVNQLKIFHMPSIFIYTHIHNMYALTNRYMHIKPTYKCTHNVHKNKIHIQTHKVNCINKKKVKDTSWMCKHQRKYNWIKATAPTQNYPLLKLLRYPSLSFCVLFPMLFTLWAELLQRYSCWFSV